jgi:hypothetical protein
MRSLSCTILLSLALVPACGARPGGDTLDDATLKALAAQPWDKARLMNTRERLGIHHGVPVIAEYPCSDVCPQYTVRIIHYELPPGADCARVGGVEQSVGVPVAIAVMPRSFCFPKVLVEAKLHYVR